MVSLVSGYFVDSDMPAQVLARKGCLHYDADKTRLSPGQRII
jgi:hypothetical protein